MRFDFSKNIFIEKEINNNKLAISGSDNDVIWKELENNVETFCKTFKEINIPKGQPVMIYGHKESFYAQAILSCIKFDIPYVPIDEIYPIERIKKIQSITQAQVLINCSSINIDFKFAIEINKKFEIITNYAPQYSKDNIFNAKDPLRYIMFTSGSTGEPKGVQITRKNILSFLDWIKKDYNFKTDDVFLNQSPFTFDVSLYDILSSFMIGASVVLISRKLASNTELFINKIKEYAVSIWTSTPSFAYIYLREEKFNINYLPKLRSFIFAGEILSFNIVKSLLQKFENPIIINAYGPTEATITTTWITIDKELITRETKMPIGYPRRDSEILIDNIEDDKTKEGEIIIVGDHVSPGYYKNEKLNKSKFFTYHNKQAFRTGDLGFYKNNIIYFNGRNDEQIKLHGYRIELGEIDNEINKIHFVDDSVTIPLKRKEEVKRIISFVILKSDFYFNDIKNQIIQQIKNKLPSYMLPSDIIAIEKFPINANHKIDKKQLIKLYNEM